MFVSAAEARWDFDDMFKGTPVGWMHDYLVAKRTAEDEVCWCRLHETESIYYIR